MLAAKRFFKLDLKILTVFPQPSLGRAPEGVGVFFPFPSSKAGPWPEDVLPRTCVTNQ